MNYIIQFFAQLCGSPASIVDEPESNKYHVDLSVITPRDRLNESQSIYLDCVKHIDECSVIGEPCNICTISDITCDDASKSIIAYIFIDIIRACNYHIIDYTVDNQMLIRSIALDIMNIHKLDQYVITMHIDRIVDYYFEKTMKNSYDKPQT